MKPIRFHPEAESEMIEAAAWYESQQTDLGKRFLTSVQDTLNRVELNPTLNPFVRAWPEKPVTTSCLAPE